MPRAFAGPGYPREAAASNRQRRAKNIPDRDRGIGGSARRQPDEGVAPAPRRRREVRGRRRPVDGARRAGVAVSDRAAVDYGTGGGCETVPEYLSPYPGNRPPSGRAPPRNFRGY